MKLKRADPDFKQENDDAELARFGYVQQFARTLGSFKSFAFSFSTMAIITGIFGGYGAMLSSAGPAGIWMWPIACLGQLIVCLVLAQFAARVPLAGMSYSWAASVSHPILAWIIGWISLVGWAVGAASVSYTFASQAAIPLLGLEHSAALERGIALLAVVIACAIIICSTRITAFVNALGVSVELAGLAILIGVLTLVLIFSDVDVGSNLTARTAGSLSEYFSLNGPFMMAALLPLYTIIGFEACAAMAEETRDSAVVVPKAMIRATLVSAIVGMILLVLITGAIPDLTAATQSEVPVAYILQARLGSGIERIVLAMVCLTTFAATVVLLAATSRLIFAKARDGMLVGNGFLVRVSPVTRTPVIATVAACAAAAGILFAFPDNSLYNLFLSLALNAPVLYLLLVVLWIMLRRRLESAPDTFSLGRWDLPLSLVSIAWLLFSIEILGVPEANRAAATFTVVSIALGIALLLTLLIGRWFPSRRVSVRGEIGS